MQRKILFSPFAAAQLAALEKKPALSGVLRQVRKTLGLLETNLRTPSLHTHEFTSLTRRYGVKVFEAYAQQHTPGAYRVFWCFGDEFLDANGKRNPTITVLAITPHPE